MWIKTGKKIFLTIFIFIPILLFSQKNPFIEVQINKQKITQDQILSVTFVLFSEKEADEIPHWKIEDSAFTTEYQMMSPHKSISMSYINGVRSEKKEFRYNYTYLLRCSKIGNYRIASPVFKVNNENLGIKYFELEVVGIEKNPFYQLILSSLPKTVFVGERLNFDLDLVFQRQISTPRYRINGLEPFDYILSNRGLIDNAIKVTLNDKPVEGAVITLDGKQIFRMPLSLILKNTGKLSFGETHAGFRGVSTSSRMGFFGQYDEEEIMIPVEGAKELTVEVLPLPERGRPKDFTGLIGKLRLKVEATPTELKEGDPLTLTISIENINDYLFELPPFSQQEPFFSQFRIPDAAPGKIENGNKIFIQTIRPLTKEVNSIPSISLNYYDTQNHRYSFLKSDPIPLTVHEAVTISEDQIIYNTVAGRDLAIRYKNSRQFHNLAEKIGGENLSYPSKWKRASLIELFLILLFSILLIVLIFLNIGVKWNLFSRYSRIKNSSLTPILTQILLQWEQATSFEEQKSTLENAHNLLIGVEAKNDFQKEKKREALAQIDRMLFGASMQSNFILSQEVQWLKALKEQSEKEDKKRSKKLKKSAIIICFLLSFPFSCTPSFSTPSKPQIPLAEVNQLLLEAKMDFDNGLDLIITQESSPLNFFQSAYEKWNQLIKAGYQDGRIHFNLGNCARFMKEDPLALYHYKMALLIEENPLYREAVDAVIEANGLTQEKNPFLTFAHRLLYWNHQKSNLFRAMLLSFFLMFYALITFIIQIKPSLQKKGKAINRFLSIAFLLTLAAFFADFAMPKPASEGVILIDTEGRAGNSYAYENPLSNPLYPTQIFRLLEEREGWLYIALSNGIKCWIPQNSAKLIR